MELGLGVDHLYQLLLLSTMVTIPSCSPVSCHLQSPDSLLFDVDTRLDPVDSAVHPLHLDPDLDLFPISSLQMTPGGEG